MYDITCLWYSGATNIMIKRRHTKPHNTEMCYNQVEYITAAEPYCTINDAKVPFFMPYFSSSKIISHRFNIDNNECESGISYDTIIGCDLMVHLGILSNFKCQYLQWDGSTVPMKEPRSLLGHIDLRGHKMFKVEMQTAEPFSTR